MDPVHTSLSRSLPDSQRFGLRVMRGSIAEIDDRKLIEEIVSAEADVVIIRVPAGSGRKLQRLARVGMHPIHADTLVYYQVSLTQYDPRPLRNADLEFTQAGPGDASDLEALVAGTFVGYNSHYHANPRLDEQKILAGYVEWASGYLTPADETRITWVARRQGRIVAFACCSHDRSAGRCEGILYGVHPEHSGGGLYGDLIRYTQASFRERGFETMEVSTQIWNLAVQKVWSREGFVLNRAYDTFHINAMLSHGEAVVEQELRFSHAQVEQFAALTGDANPVHLNEDSARAAGFDGRISHGMLAGGELSRIFGTVAPGLGTLFLRSELVFLNPIYPGRSYRLVVRLPTSRRGYVPAVATIRGLDGSLCLLSYSDLLTRS